MEYTKGADKPAKDVENGPLYFRIFVQLPQLMLNDKKNHE